MKNVFNLFLIVLLLVSCQGNSQEKTKEKKDLAEKLTNMNKILIENESKRIDEFITRHNFKTERTGSGLRYEIYVHGKGEKPVAHDEVEIKYRVYLLDDKLCYSSDSSGSVKMKLGEGDQIRGLEEGLLLMVPGDKGHFILPAHLAYGMSGDQGNIPPASSVYFDVELLNIKK